MVTTWMNFSHGALLDVLRVVVEIMLEAQDILEMTLTKVL